MLHFEIRIVDFDEKQDLEQKLSLYGVKEKFSEEFGKREMGKLETLERVLHFILYENRICLNLDQKQDEINCENECRYWREGCLKGFD